MKKSVISLCAWGIASIVTWGVARPSLAQESDAGSTLSKYRGDWACTFQSSASASVSLMGIELFHLDRAGRVIGEETVVNVDPFVELRTTFGGRFSPQANGTLKGVMVLHVIEPPGIPDQEFDILCAGMVPQGDRYTEIRCLDVFPQADGSKIVGFLMCKRR